MSRILAGLILVLVLEYIRRYYIRQQVKREVTKELQLKKVLAQLDSELPVLEEESGAGGPGPKYRVRYREIGAGILPNNTHSDLDYFNRNIQS